MAINIDKLKEAKQQLDTNIDRSIGRPTAKKVLLSVVLFLTIPTLIFRIGLPYLLKALDLENNALAILFTIIVVILLIGKVLYVLAIQDYLDMQETDIPNIFLSLVVPGYVDKSLKEYQESSSPTPIEGYDIWIRRYDIDIPGFTLNLAMVLSVLTSLTIIGSLIYEGIVMGFTATTPIIVFLHLLMAIFVIITSIVRNLNLGIIREQMGDYMPFVNNSNLKFLNLFFLIGFTVYTTVMFIGGAVGINLSIPALQIIFIIFPLIINPILSYFGIRKAYKYYFRERTEALMNNKTGTYKYI